MKTSQSISALAEALAKAQGKFRLVEKTGENVQQRYKFAGLDDYLRMARQILAECQLSLSSDVTSVTELAPRQTKSGSTQYGCRVEVTTRLLHASGEWVEAGSFGEGFDAGDKAIYKAITGARKYGVAAVLGLATSDDPERDEEGAATGVAMASEDALAELRRYSDDERLPAPWRQRIAAKLDAHSDRGGPTADEVESVLEKVRNQLRAV